MLNELLKSALVLLVSFGLKALLAALKVEIDETLFNTIVAAVVAYVLALLGVDLAIAAAKDTRAARFLHK